DGTCRPANPAYRGRCLLGSLNNKGWKSSIQTRPLVEKRAALRISTHRKKLILTGTGNETKKSTKTIEKE
ncbi:hypothetical protein ACCS96_27005, partial [Rhizobium ruizarguesonis]